MKFGRSKERKISRTPQDRIANIIFEKKNTTQARVKIGVKIILYLVTASFLGAIISGINVKNKLINFVYEEGKKYRIVEVEKIGEERSGTGDVISGVIAGKYLLEQDFYKSVVVAADFASKCIKYSQELGVDNHLGLCFEPFLKEL